MIVKLIQIAMIQKLREYSKEYSIIPTQNNLNQFNKVMKSSENEQEIKEDGNVSKSIIEKIKYFISFYIKYIVFIILTFSGIDKAVKQISDNVSSDGIEINMKDIGFINYNR